MAAAVEEQWPEIDLFRLCIVGYLRHFHGVSDARRRRLIRRGPRLTGTVWDAAVGASIEHVCLTHGYRPPAWTDEPERVRHGPEVLLDPLSDNVVCHLPAPFARRGVALDTRDLDARGGDAEPWRPDVGDPDLVVRHVIIFGYGHGLQRAIIDESQHRTPERLIMAQH